MAKEQTPESPGAPGAEQAADLPYGQSALDAARAVAQGAALVAAALGAAGLSGWILGVDVLRRVPGADAAMNMNANTAVALLALGLSLFLVVRRRATWWAITAARAAAALAAVIGVLTVAEDVTGVGLGIDELLFKDDTARLATEAPGRMAPNTASSSCHRTALPAGSGHRSVCHWASTIRAAVVCRSGRRRSRCRRAAFSRSTPTDWSKGPAPTSRPRSASSPTPLDVALKGAPTGPESLDHAADQLIRTLLPETATHDDDVTLLLIELPEPDGTSSRSAHARPGANGAASSEWSRSVHLRNRGSD